MNLKNIMAALVLVSATGLLVCAAGKKTIAAKSPSSLLSMPAKQIRALDFKKLSPDEKRAVLLIALSSGLEHQRNAARALLSKEPQIKEQLSKQGGNWDRTLMSVIKAKPSEEEEQEYDIQSQPELQEASIKEGPQPQQAKLIKRVRFASGTKEGSEEPTHEQQSSAPAFFNPEPMEPEQQAVSQANIDLL